MIDGHTFLEPFAQTPRDIAYIHVYAEHIAKLLPPERRHTAVQAGGHVGIVPYILSCYFEKVITFEPDPDNFKAMMRNLNFLGNFGDVTMMEGALGERGKFVGIERSATGRSILSKTVSPPFAQLWPVEGCRIPCFPLDQFAFRAVDLLALDTAGHELDALNGAVDTVYKHRPVIVCEIREGIHEWMTAHGYTRHSIIRSDWIFMYNEDLDLL
jgi:FkbM family methyltransferase